jgi:hypothetical protein
MHEQIAKLKMLLENDFEQVERILMTPYRK